MRKTFLMIALMLGIALLSQPAFAQFGSSASNMVLKSNQINTFFSAEFHDCKPFTPVEGIMRPMLAVSPGGLEAVQVCLRVDGMIEAEMADPGFGLAMEDETEGFGFVMYTKQNKFERFTVTPPHHGTGENLIVVRYNDDLECWTRASSANWGPVAWLPFEPHPEDVLIAEVFWGLFSYENAAERIHIQNITELFVGKKYDPRPMAPNPVGDDLTDNIHSPILDANDDTLIQHFHNIPLGLCFFGGEQSNLEFHKNKWNGYGNCGEIYVTTSDGGLPTIMPDAKDTSFLLRAYVNQILLDEPNIASIEFEAAQQIVESKVAFDTENTGAIQQVGQPVVAMSDLMMVEGELKYKFAIAWQHADAIGIRVFTFRGANEHGDSPCFNVRPDDFDSFPNPNDQDPANYYVQLHSLEMKADGEFALALELREKVGTARTTKIGFYDFDEVTNEITSQLVNPSSGKPEFVDVTGSHPVLAWSNHGLGDLNLVTSLNRVENSLTHDGIFLHRFDGPNSPDVQFHANPDNDPRIYTQIGLANDVDNNVVLASMVGGEGVVVEIFDEDMDFVTEIDDYPFNFRNPIGPSVSMRQLNSSEPLDLPGNILVGSQAYNDENKFASQFSVLHFNGTNSSWLFDEAEPSVNGTEESGHGKVTGKISADGNTWWFSHQEGGANWMVRAWWIDQGN